MARGGSSGSWATSKAKAAFYTAEVVEPGEVLVVPTERVRALVAHDPVLSDLILRAYLLRRSLLIQEESGFRIIGSCYSPDTTRLREFAARTDCHTDGLTWNVTSTPNGCCSGWEYRPKTPRW